MDFWDQTVSATKKFISVAEKKTQEIVNVQKLNYKLSSIQNNINQKYCELGKSVYAALKDGQALETDSFAEPMGEIDALKKELKAVKKELDETKGKINCPDCNAVCDLKAKYCHKCGKEL